MKNMSFAMTTEQVVAQTKTVTRRFGWYRVKPGDFIQPVQKSMGVKRGEKVVRLGSPIIVVSARIEPLDLITQEDVAKEGFPDWTTDQFVSLLTHHYNCKPWEPVNRIEFKYTKSPSGKPICCFFCRKSRNRGGHCIDSGLERGCINGKFEEI